VPVELTKSCSTKEEKLNSKDFPVQIDLIGTEIRDEHFLKTIIRCASVYLKSLTD